MRYDGLGWVRMGRDALGCVRMGLGWVRMV